MFPLQRNQSIDLLNICDIFGGLHYDKLISLVKIKIFSANLVKMTIVHKTLPSNTMDPTSKDFELTQSLNNHMQNHIKNPVKYLKVVKYFREKLHHRCFTGFLIRFQYVCN